jgi:outer membrane protein
MRWWSAKTLVIAVAIIVVLAAAGFVATRSGPPALAMGQPLVIGYVDMGRALDAHPGKARAESALRDYAQAQIAEAQMKMRDLTAAQRQDLQRQVNAEIMKRRADLLGGLENDIRAAVQRVAKQQGVSIVMTREVVLYGGIDLTGQVIKVISGK